MRVKLSCGCPMTAFDEIIPHDAEGWIFVPVTLESLLGGPEKMPDCKNCGQRIVERVEGQ